MVIMIWNKSFISMISQLRLCMERSHSGLVRRFAKPLRWKRLREFESLPLRHQYMPMHVLVIPNRGVAQLAEQPSPKRQVAGSIPVSPAQTPGHYMFRSFYFLPNVASRYSSTRFDVTFLPAYASLYNEICYTLFEISAE